MRIQIDIRILFTIAILSFISLACNASFSIGGGDPAITSITTCKAVTDDQACEGQTSAFEATETVYASIAAENLEEGDVLEANWKRSGEVMKTFTLPVDRSGSGDVSFSLIPDNALPNGDYSVEISLNDTVMQSATFTVSGAVPLVGPVTTCKTVTDNAECEGADDHFVGDETVYAAVFAENMVAGDEVKANWFWGDEQIYDVAITMEESGSFPVEFHLEPDAALKPGTYSVQILYNNEPVQAAEFRVTWPEPRIGQITTCKTVSDNQVCQGQETVFSGAEVIYVGTEVLFLRAGDRMTIRWYLEDEPIGEFTLPAEADFSGPIAFNFSPDADRLLPTSDDYRAELYIGDALAETITFQVDNSLAEPASDVDSQPAAAGWETLTSRGWRIQLNYPDSWEVQNNDNALAFLGPNRTLFYLTAYQATSPADTENQAAIDQALSILLDSFADFKHSEVIPFALGDSPGLTADYAYVDADNNEIRGSVIVGTSEGGITYTVYIEALTEDYEAALAELNEMLATLEFQ